jgi:hypothetical protein
VEPVRADAYDIKVLHIIGNAFHKVYGVGAEKDAQLVKGVEVLELHIIFRGAGIVVKEIKEIVVFLVDAKIILVLIQREILCSHRRYL